MKPSFDPYNEWLHIPDSRRPPKDYDLLGLAAGESDVDQIHAAFQRRYEFVRKYQNGRHSEVAQRMLHELTRASESMKAAAVQGEPRLEPCRAEVERFDPYEPEDVAAIARLIDDATTASTPGTPPEVEQFEPAELAETAHSIDDAKMLADGTPQTISVASAQKALQAQPNHQKPPMEISFEPTDKQQPQSEDDFLSRVVTGLAVGCGIIALLGFWLPEVAIYFVSLLIVFGCWHVCNTFNSPPWRLLGSHIRTWARAKESYWAAKRAWSTTSATHRRIVKKLQKCVKSLVDKRSALPSSKNRELEAIRKRAHEAQLHSFLLSYSIRDNLESIPNVGNVRLNALESCGIKTAYEVQYERIVSVTGCGDSTASNLVTWRTNVARRFRFDEGAVPKEELLNIERKYTQQEQQIDHEISQTLNEVRSLNRALQRDLAPLETTLRDAENDTNHAWAVVQGQMASLTKAFVAIVLAVFATSILTLVIIRHLKF